MEEDDIYSEYPTVNYGMPQVPKPKPVLKKMDLYDRLEAQWLVLIEVSIQLTSISSSVFALLFLRALGLTAISVGLVVSAVVSIAGILILYWEHLARPVLKVRLFFFLVVLSFAVAIATGDAIADWVNINIKMLSLVASVLVMLAIAAGVFGIAVARSIASNKFRSEYGGIGYDQE